MKRQKAILALEDGSVFTGFAFGASKTVVGEAVFNTSITGYQELLTDPSNFGKILNMTAVEIGNYGVNKADEESDGVKATGLVVRELSPVASNWRSESSLDEYLKANGVPAISGVDTRAITKKLRTAGTMKACLSTEDISAEDAVARARDWVGVEGVDYVKEVTCSKVYKFEADEKDLAPFTVAGTTLYKTERRQPLIKCAAIDFGAKRSTFKTLSFAGFDVTVFPATATAEEIMEFAPECLFLSSGAGDPSAVTYAHNTVAKLMKEIPTFGIGLGHQIIAHAMGAKTTKLKFGHHGGNHPVKNVETERVSITAQNHDFAVDAESLEKAGGIVTEINLNDKSVEGLRHKEYPVYSVQYNPDSTQFVAFYDFVKNVKG